jgi:hypothetical protein
MSKRYDFTHIFPQKKSDRVWDIWVISRLQCIMDFKLYLNSGFIGYIFYRSDTEVIGVYKSDY